ncbi:MAG: MFS transporter [Candidatus Aminicenantes bacterium]|nr:MFS transporter [Candidatus Aminicenantes bacterium]
MTHAISGRRTPSSAFFRRDFLVALLGYFFLFMSMTLFFIFPLFLGRFGASQSRVGLIMGIHSLMAILVRPFFGRQIDRRGGKRLSLLGLGLLMAVMPLFHLVKDAGFLPVFLRALTGLGWGVSMTATITICSDLAPLDRLAHSIGVVGAAGLVASAVGPMLAEEIVRFFGFGWLFNAGLGFIVLAFVCLLVIREVPRPESNGRPPGRKLFVGLTPAMILLIGLMPVVHGAVRSAVIYFIALFGKSLALERIGPFFFAFSTAAILTRLSGGDLSDRFGRKRVIFPAALIIGLNLLGLSLVKSFWPFVLAGFVAGLGQGLIFPALSTYLIDIIGRERKGTALGLYLSLFDAGMAMGAPFFGWISDLWNYPVMYAAAGGLMLAVAALFHLKAPELRVSRRPAESP